MASKIINHRAIALEYMRENRVDKLFEILGAKLVKERAVDPNEFLLSELHRIAEVKSNGQKATLFSEHDIEVMFNVFDITKKGHIKKEQYMKALYAIGVQVPRIPVPEGSTVDKSTFMANIYGEVLLDSY